MSHQESPLPCRALQFNKLNSKPKSKAFSVENPKSVLIYCKPMDEEVLFNCMKIFDHLHSKYSNILVHVEQWVLDEFGSLPEDQHTENFKNMVFPEIFVNTSQQIRESIDYIVTLGGDGTILWASKQFHGDYIPPLICFSHGSLGYLCNFKFEEYEEVFENAFGSKLHLDNRLRLKCGVPNQPQRKVYRGNDLVNYQMMDIDNFHIINEIVVDRGPSSTSIQLELFFDGNYMTNMVGDGIIIATPTGSTAYNMSAGGSIVQANTQCLCVTPLAPHSLSFRPLIIPVSTKITLRKADDNRNSAWVSLDGGTRFELQPGEELTIQGSEASLGMVINPSDNLVDLWSQRLTHMLGWNKRDALKPL